MTDNFPRDVLASALFGSSAREEADESSDVDILAVVSATTLARFRELQVVIAERFTCQTEDVSIYTTSACERMAAQGAPFMHHLASEAIILYDPTGFLKTCLDKLRPFSGYAGQLLTYLSLLGLVEENLQSDFGLTECDLHQLHMLKRNTCILLCLQKGESRFGRLSPISHAKELYPQIPLREGDLSLSPWALTYSRNAPTPEQFPSKREQADQVQVVIHLIAFAKEVLDEA